MQSAYRRSQFRTGFDLVVPPILGPPGGDIWQECAQMVPARRKYLLSFQGEMKSSRSSPTPRQIDDAEIDIERLAEDENNLDSFIIQHLKEMTSGTVMDKFHMQFECIPASEEQRNDALDWSLCGTESSRKEILRESTFSLILTPMNASFVTTASIQARLYEALRFVMILVVFGVFYLGKIWDYCYRQYCTCNDWVKPAQSSHLRSSFKNQIIFFYIFRLSYLIVRPE